MQVTENRIAIHWFRRDLRLHDNHALSKAIASGLRVQAVFIFDSNILSRLRNKHDARLTFIHDALSAINTELQAYGGSLTTYHGDPIEVWEKIVNDFNPAAVFCNRDYEPYARERDMAVHNYLKDRGIEMSGSKDHVIFEKHEVVKDDGKPYTVFTPYSKKWKSKILATTFEPFDCSGLNKAVNPQKPQAIHSLESIGMAPADRTHFPAINPSKSIIDSYHKTRDTPSIIGTTRLSVHLRFGTISVRSWAQEGMRRNEKWLNELIWRDFYQMIIYHFPHTVDKAFKPAYDRIPWRSDEVEFKAWCEGRTGYPIVDAGMRELNTTGFMHNRVRMIVASFLTKHLLIDWRWGERYFAEMLLDFELASNVGGWQWAASSGCDAAPYFRVFNPTLQTEKFDPVFAYIKKWVPEWNSPAYPKPVVDHKFARDRVLNAFKSALQGNDA